MLARRHQRRRACASRSCSRTSPRGCPGVQADGCPLDAGRGGGAQPRRAPRAPVERPELHDLDFLERADAGRARRSSATWCKSAVEIFVDRYAATSAADDVATLAASAEAIADWLLARPEPFAVIHGDYRLDNLMFGADADDVVAVDWQTLAVGPPARDVAYFLGTSIQVDERRGARGAPGGRLPRTS